MTRLEFSLTDRHAPLAFALITFAVIAALLLLVAVRIVAVVSAGLGSVGA